MYTLYSTFLLSCHFDPIHSHMVDGRHLLFQSDHVSSHVITCDPPLLRFDSKRNSWRRRDNRKTAPTVEFNRKEPSQPTRAILGAISKSQRKHVDICPFLRDQSVAIKTTLAKTQRLLVSAVSEWVLGECGQECGPGSQTVRQHRQAGGE